MARKLIVEVVGDTSSLERALGRSQTKMGKFKKAALGAALGAGAGIAYGLGKVAKIGWDEFNQGQKVAAQTNAVLKSTGGVANVTAKEVQSLAQELMLKSGVDDEAIASGENMLLTFKQIRNETGKGNDIFNQATKATLDLSVAMGKDMSDSAIMVGKALNDPIRGLTAMRRVGIQFTEAQEEQIKAMVEAGDVMGAQKVILKELESQFGGSAKAAGETFGGQINILRERFNNWAGVMVEKAIPVLQRFGEFVVPIITEAVQALSDIINKEIKPAFRSWAKVVEENEDTIRPMLRAMGIAFQVFAKVVRVALFLLRFQFEQIWLRIFNFYMAVIRRIMGVTDSLIRAWERVRDALARVRATALFTFQFFRDKAMIVVGAVQNVINKVNQLIQVIRSIPGKVGGALGKVGGFFSGLAGTIGRVSGAVGGFGDKLAVGPAVGGLNAVSALAGRFGLTMTSGFRPGDSGWHGQNRARDFAGSASGMLAFARVMSSAFGSRLLELIHSPLGYGIKNGVRVPNSFWGGDVIADHFDHVHVAMAKGGIVTRPTMALIGEAGPEAVIPLRNGGRFSEPTRGRVEVIVVGGDRPAIQWFRDLMQGYERANGGRRP